MMHLRWFMNHESPKNERHVLQCTMPMVCLNPRVIPARGNLEATRLSGASSWYDEGMTRRIDKAVKS